VRILWLKTELLHPVDKGGKIRTYHMLRELKCEHHVTYLTLDDGSAAPDAAELASEYCHRLVRIPFSVREKLTPRFYAELALNIGSRLPYAIAKYRSPAMRAAIESRARSGYHDVLVCDFLAPSVNLRDGLPCAQVLFQHNVEAMIWRRHVEAQNNVLKRAYVQRQWQKMLTYERDQCRRFDHVIAVSREDADTIRRDYGVEAVSDVPTGVDTEFFRPRADYPAGTHELVFTGSMDWMPNQDAIAYFVAEILPRLRRSIPQVTLTVVGRNPPPALEKLARADASIKVTGYVEDVRPYMERAAGYVVPLRVGGGTRLKIFEAMAMERPVVSTSIGAEGLPVRDGVELLIGDSPDEFAEAVIRVLRDPVAARRLGRSGAELVRKKYAWGRVADSFAAICEDVRRNGRRGFRQILERTR
jgi:sugar transferase (PEP-CTERM/EpsH1 system associated)